ncbi:MAG: type II toxin-antitoxin system HicA family toxin [Solirubrobacteraceae bacterium]|nr:type II toxin-antitoxin system HicA family toxin [Solirubrobacteraceae bacterium]
MKLRDLERHLERSGCERIRHGSKHDVWQGPSGRSTVPRHREIPTGTARKICEQLGAPEPRQR